MRKLSMAKRWLFPNRIKRYRKKAGKTQAQIAKLLGTSVGAYQHIEYGNRDPSTTLGIRLALVLNCDIADLYKKAALLVGEEKQEHMSQLWLEKARKAKRKAKKK